MLKQVHRAFFTILMILALATPCVLADNIEVKSENPAQTNLIQNDVRVNDLDIDPLNTKKVKKEVAVDTKSEGKKVFVYFFKVMSGVIICAILLYLILVFVKKFYGSAFNTIEEDEYEELSLSTPQNKEEALKMFLNRTKD